MCFKSLISYGFTLPLALMNGYISLALFVYLVTIKFLFTTERDLQKKMHTRSGKGSKGFEEKLRHKKNLKWILTEM